MSLFCPKCGETTLVIDSRERPLNGASAIKRWRRCKECKHRFSTFESVQKPSNLLEAARKMERSINKSVAESVAAFSREVRGIK